MLQMPLPNMNLATYILTCEGKSVADYDGWCSTVADKVLDQFGGALVYVDGDALYQHDWAYHVVPLVEGKIHDAWLDAWNQVPEPQTIANWLVKMFGTEDEINVTIDAEDVYSGLPQHFCPKSTDIPINSELTNSAKPV